MKFFVAKVDIKKVKRDSHGLVVLSPLRFSFDAAELRLPVRLGLLNAEGKQDLIVYVLHPDKRFEVANYPNVFIPTNIEVADSVRKSFGSLLRRAVRRDAAAQQQPGGGHRVRLADHVAATPARRRRWSRATCTPWATTDFAASRGPAGPPVRSSGPTRPALLRQPRALRADPAAHPL